MLHAEFLTALSRAPNQDAKQSDSRREDEPSAPPMDHPMEAEAKETATGQLGASGPKDQWVHAQLKNPQAKELLFCDAEE